jgi:hypothetical protein
MALFRLFSNFLTPTVNGAVLHSTESKTSTAPAVASALSSCLLTGLCRNNISFQVMGERYLRFFRTGAAITEQGNTAGLQVLSRPSVN